MLHLVGDLFELYDDARTYKLKFYIYILAHPVCKMWIIHEPKKVALWKKRHFEEKKTESVQHV